LKAQLSTKGCDPYTFCLARQSLQVNPKFIHFEAYLKILKNTIRHSLKNHKQVITGVVYVIDQNVKIFRGFVHHRPYFRRFSKNPFKNPIGFRAREP